MKKQNNYGTSSYTKKIITAILALLMIGGVLFSALLSSGIFSANAAEYDSYAFSSNQTSEKYIAIGLMYDDGITVGYETTAPSGYIIGTALIANGSRAFSPLWKVSDKTVTVTCDANLSKSDKIYSHASSTENVVVGGYHLEYSLPVNSENDAKTLISTFNTALEETDYYAFPAHINGAFKVRIGQFSTYESAQSAAEAITTAVSDNNFYIVSPDANGVSLINQDTETILFEYTNSNDYYLGLTPIQDGETTYYTKAYPNPQSVNQYIYSGVFCYRRCKVSGLDGVAVTNLLPLDEYVEGVLPWEISASWPIEVQKAFAITTRSYALANMGKHYNKNGFDLCSETHCQAYLGRSRVNDKVMEAVAATKDLVLSYNNKIISSNYTSTMGGASVRSSQAWGGEYSYLVSQPTPWERYSDPKTQNGLWEAEVSPEDLYNYLRNVQGYTALTSPISEIKINQLSDNTDYVYSLSVFDSSGHSINLQRTDTVRGKLTRYVKSANFVVGKGSVTRTYQNVVHVSVKDNNVIGQQEDNFVYEFPLNKISVINGNNEIVANESTATQIITSSGNVSAKNAAVITFGGYAKKGDTSVTVTVSHFTFTVELETVTETLSASDPNNFIFAGKGWGHGVGLSQSGAYDLAELGIAAKDILEIYYPGTVVADFKNLH